MVSGTLEKGSFWTRAPGRSSSRVLSSCDRISMLGVDWLVVKSNYGPFLGVHIQGGIDIDIDVDIDTDSLYGWLSKLWSLFGSFVEYGS